MEDMKFVVQREEIIPADVVETIVRDFIETMAAKSVFLMHASNPPIGASTETQIQVYLNKKTNDAFSGDPGLDGKLREQEVTIQKLKERLPMWADIISENADVEDDGDVDGAANALAEMRQTAEQL